MYQYYCIDWGKNDSVVYDKLPCEFPMAPKGWGVSGEGCDNQEVKNEDGVVGNDCYDDVVLGDCSITYADSLDGGYEMVRGVYTFVAFIGLCLCAWCLHISYKKRLTTKKKDVL